MKPLRHPSAPRSSALRSFALRTGVVAGTALTAAALLTVPADATVVGTYSYQNAATGKCLDVRAASRDDGAVIQQFSCKSGGQQDFNTRPELGQTSSDVRALHSGKCIEPLNAHPGGIIIQRGCTNSYAQRWEFIELGNQTVTIKNVATGLCLDDAGMPSGSRREVRQATCTGTAGQIWQRY
ncbi:RICIN domain-containing protein [Streptomyces sp. I05A-00742]|uniref:RICIN domain-containing protein n=1 Tax=Streptomyces sp. I05A-00742 TaxID=2732853 RepID=UPI001488608B|nr:RICIN domain-containing protein [Streptomyces sp. I05A-00742]